MESHLRCGWRRGYRAWGEGRGDKLLYSGGVDNGWLLIGLRSERERIEVNARFEAIVVDNVDELWTGGHWSVGSPIGLALIR